MGEQFRADVLRPTGTDQYDVVYESAVQIVPTPAGGSEVFSFPAGIPVQAGDHIGYFGSGVPVDTTGGTDALIYPAGAAPVFGETITLGSGNYPRYTADARTYSFAATVAPYSGSSTVTATGTSGEALQNVTGYQTFVNTGLTPLPGDWPLTTTPVAVPAPTVSITATVSAVPGQTVWIRVQRTDLTWSVEDSILVPVP